MLRAGIIGAGYAAAAHARGYSAIEASGVRLAVVADRHLERAEKLANRYGARAVGSMEAMLKAGVDLISVCTPTDSHAAIAIEAMTAGKHVLCEKPIARTLDQAQRMMQVSQERGVKLMIAHVSRFEPDHLKARELLDRGDLGRLCMGFQSITAPFPDWNPYWYQNAEKSGGPLLDLAIHSIDYLLWLFGSRPIRVHAVGPLNARGLATYGLISLRLEDGGMGLVETSWAQPSAQPLHLRTELVGTSGRLEWNYEGISALQVTRDKGGRRTWSWLGRTALWLS